MSVVLSYLTTGIVSHSFMDSVMRVDEYERKHGRELYARLPIHAGPHSLGAARDAAVSELIRVNADWLLFIDTDMGFRDDALKQLLDVADADERPFVAGHYYALYTSGDDGYGGQNVDMIPALYRKTADGSKFEQFKDYEEGDVVKVDATGSAFTLCHRTAYEKVIEKFNVCYQNIGPAGEDMSFCTRMGALDIPMYVHSGVRVTHHKRVWVG